MHWLVFLHSFNHVILCTKFRYSNSWFYLYVSIQFYICWDESSGSSVSWSLVW